jgi:hypothetical protein
MAMHTTIHLTPADVIALVTALKLYREQVERDNASGKDQDGLHINNLIAKLQR